MEHSPILYALALFSSAMVGGAFFFLTNKQSSNGIKLLLSFSAAYLLGLTLLHLFPELFESGIDHAGWWVLAGFMLQVILDFFSHGVEHGHAHSHQHAGTKFFVMVMISLWIHAFIEGMPFGRAFSEGAADLHTHDHSGHHHHHEVGDGRNSLLIGISLHKITESLVFTALLVNSGWSKRKALIWLIIFALVAPAGAFFHYAMGEMGVSGIETFTPKITGILIGILLHVSTTILFETEDGHKFNWQKFLSILLGIGMAALVM